MDEKKKRLFLLVGGVGALLILGLVLMLVVGGEEEAPPQPEAPPPVAEAPPEGEAAPAAAAPARVKDLTTDKRTTLQAIAARKDVYGDASKWWALFKANPSAVRYLFQNSTGTWVALVPQGTKIVVPEPAPVLPDEQARLRQGFGAYSVQFGSYTERANTQSLLDLLKKAEPAVDFYESQMVVDGVQYYRARAGVFSRWEDAEKFGQATDMKHGEVSDYYTVAIPEREQKARNAELEKIYGQ
ncbi:MAG: SPOR domain-containing protein [Bdellovibrionota bacterium]